MCVKILVRVLEREIHARQCDDLTIDIASSVEQAKSKCSYIKYDLIFLDNNMEINVLLEEAHLSAGLFLLQYIKTKTLNNGTTIISHSDALQAEETLRSKYQLSGVTLFLAKPLVIERLKAILDDLSQPLITASVPRVSSVSNISG